MKKILPRLSYYRNTLADAARQNPDFQKLIKDKGLLRCSREEVLSGKIGDKERVKAFFTVNGDKQPASGVLCPWIYTPQVTHGATSGKYPFALICIPVVMSPEGIFQPKGDKPWIPRTVLQPLNSEGTTVGSVRDSDGFLSTLLSEEIQTWESLMDVCKKYLAYVTGSETPQNMEGYDLDPEGGFFSDDSPQGNASAHVKKLYDALQREKLSLPLLTRLIEGKSTTLPLISKKEETELSSRHLGCMSPEFPLSPSQRTALHHLMKTPEGEILALNGPPGTGKTTMLQSVVAHLWIEAALHRRECPLMVASSTNNQAVTNVIDSFGKVGTIEGDHLYERWVPDITSFGLQMARENRWKETYHSYDNPFQGNKPSTAGIFGEIENAEWLAKAEAFFLDQASKRYGTLSSISSAIETIHGDILRCAKSIQSLIEGITELSPSPLRYQDIQEDIDKEEKALAQAQKDLASTEEKEILWEKHLSSEPFLTAVLSFIPSIGKRRESRDRAFLLEHGLESSYTERESMGKAFLRLKAERRELIEKAQREIEKLRTSAAHLDRIWTDLKKAGEMAGISVEEDDLSLGKTIQKLDTQVRAKAFRLASHYWEGKYLEELREVLGDPRKKDSASPEKKALMYRRFAKLFPCQIATFYMLPHYYCGYRGKEIFMYNEIDLLIVDEAGQVSPEIGTPSFALAKRALVVGDTFQIEPVWSVASGTDSANAMESGVVHSEEEYEKEEPQGYFAASGNLMRMAQQACSYTQYQDLCPGLMLVEHRRCLPEIIAYCNDLVYGGKLEPHRRHRTKDVEKRPSFLPIIGEIPVLDSTDETSSGSRRNKTEAKAIAQWIKDHRESLEKAYEKGIGEIIGVITPFTAQKRTIQDSLKSTLGNQDIVVGTVHALQGAERDVVIFSPTYGSGHSGNTFFDSGPNMMNVAVSRARDSFIVLGNPELFKEDRDTPSGILARHIRQGAARKTAEG